MLALEIQLLSIVHSAYEVVSTTLQLFGDEVLDPLHVLALEELLNNLPPIWQSYSQLRLSKSIRLAFRLRTIRFLRLSCLVPSLSNSG